MVNIHIFTDFLKNAKKLLHIYSEGAIMVASINSGEESAM